MSELISIIVPVYNAKRFLDRCIESVLTQEYTNWELLLVDDGSMDGSGELCDQWSKQDERIRVIHQKNQGVSAARNTGIREVKGKYIAFVDADDWVEPQYLEVLYWGVQQADVSLCGVQTEQSAVPLSAEIVTVEQMRRTPSQYTDLHYVNYSINKLYERERLRKNGLVFPETMRCSEDVVFVGKYLMQCETVCICPQVLYHYCTNDCSATHKFYEGVCRDESVVMELQERFFHPEPLSASEEQAFHLWEYGKVLGILRYIVNYADDKRKYFASFLRNPAVRACFSTPPEQCGRKARLAAFLAEHELLPPLAYLVKYM